MSRLMSVAMTADAVIERRKTVTRRKGWWADRNGRQILKVGDTLTLCRYAETEAEGFPGLSPFLFVQTYFVDAQGISELDDVTRIEWRYLDDEATS